MNAKIVPKTGQPFGGAQDRRAGGRSGVVIAKLVERPAARVVCLPHAGGGASAFHGWHRSMPPDVEVCAIELPGRGSRFREPAFTSMEEVIDHVMLLTEPLVDVRYLLCGHSMGGVIALEVARRWCDKGRPPHALVAAGCRAPHLPSARPRPLSKLPDDELVQALLLLEGMPAKVLLAPGFSETFLPTIRADLQCRENWRDDVRPISAPIHVLGGHLDSSVTRADLEAWKVYADSPPPVRLFDGGHFFVHENQAQVIEYLKQVLDSDDARRTPITFAPAQAQS